MPQPPKRYALLPLTPKVQPERAQGASPVCAPALHSHAPATACSRQSKHGVGKGSGCLLGQLPPAPHKRTVVRGIVIHPPKRVAQAFERGVAVRR